MQKIFNDENHSMQIDFSAAIWASDKLNKIIHRYIKPTILSDVDFIVETEDSFLFVECKNSNHNSTNSPEKFNPKSDKKLNQAAKKFYDSFLLFNFWKPNLQKKKIFCYLVEVPNGDSVLRGQIKNLIAQRLPFKLQKLCKTKKIIDEVFVMSFNEWQKKFPQFPLTRLKAEITPN